MTQKIFHIVYQDDDVLVIEKRQPFAAQRDDRSQKESLAEFISRQIGFEVLPVHRLDREVLGLMVFAKSKRAAQALFEQFKTRKVGKKYWAWLHGQLSSQEGSLVHFLKKNTKNNHVTVFPRETPGAKKAELSYRVLSAQDGRSLVEVSLKTGRTHQIRAQFAKIGHAIMGDRRYSKREVSPEISIQLKSIYLSFNHPRDGNPLEFSVAPEGKNFPL